MVGASFPEGLFDQLFDRNRLHLRGVVARQKPHLFDQAADALDALLHGRASDC